MEQYSVIFFSVATNKRFLHKIVLESSGVRNHYEWLGITFRQSKTFICFNNELPYFVGSDKMLTLANDTQRREFYKHRKNENINSDFVYPKIDFTISRRTC